MSTFFSGKVTLLWGMNGKSLSGGCPLVLTRKFQVGWLEVTFLGEVKSWFVDIGP